MSTVYEYRIFCFDEMSWITYYGTEEPTKCPHNDSHNVNHNSVQNIQQITNAPREVKVVLNESLKNGNYRMRSYLMSIPPNSTVYQDISFPYPIILLGTTMPSTEVNRGDTLRVVIHPNLAVTALANNVVIGDTTITVYSTQHFYIGLNVKINGQDIGEVVSVTGNTITLASPITQAFSSNELVSIERVLCDVYHFTAPSDNAYADRSLDGSVFPANTIGRIYYTNNSTTTTKELAIVLQYQY